MIRIIIIAYLISLYLSIPALLNKAGYKFFYGLIPFFNIYLFFKVLEINPIFLIIYSILIIIAPFRELFITILVIFLPFMIGDAYETSLKYSFLGLVLPFIIFPYIGYFHGVYQYDGGDNIEVY